MMAALAAIFLSEENCWCPLQSRLLGSTVRSSVMKASGVHWHLQQLLRPSEAKGIGVLGGAGDRELWALCRGLVSIASAFLLVSSCL